MTELKEKLIETIKGIDFTELNIYELKTVAEITDTVDKLDKKDYTDVLAETMKNTACGFGAPTAPKTIRELKEG